MKILRTRSRRGQPTRPPLPKKLTVDTGGPPVIVNEGDRVVAIFPYETDEGGDQAVEMANLFVETMELFE